MIKNIKKVLLALTLLASGLGMSAAEEVTLNVDIASHIVATVDGKEVKLHDGDNKVPVERNVHLEIKPVSGWDITRITLNDENKYVSPTAGFDYFFEDDPNIDLNKFVFVVRTAKAVDNSGTVTFNVTGARYIEYGVYDDWQRFDFVEGSQTFHFRNADESSMLIYFLEDGVEATVSQNGEPREVEPIFNSCELQFKDGDVIDISAKAVGGEVSSRFNISGLLGIVEMTVDGTLFKPVEGENFLDYTDNNAVTVNVRFAPGSTPAVKVNDRPVEITELACTFQVSPDDTVLIDSGCPYDAHALNLLVDNAANVKYISFNYVNQEFHDGYNSIPVKGNCTLEMSIASTDRYQYVALNGKELDIAYSTTGFYTAYVNPGDRLLVITDDGERPVVPPTPGVHDGSFTLDVPDADTVDVQLNFSSVDIQSGENVIEYSIDDSFSISAKEGYVLRSVTLNGEDQPLERVGYDIFISKDMHSRINGSHIVVTVEKPNSIDSVTAGAKCVDVYSIDGRVVLRGADASALSGLDKGIYIINGKKTVK